MIDILCALLGFASPLIGVGYVKVFKKLIKDDEDEREEDNFSSRAGGIDALGRTRPRQ